MSEDLVGACADILDAAVARRAAIPRLSEAYPELTVEDAYRVQDERTRRRADRGDPVIGVKLGLTSRAKQSQMQLDQPVYGRIFASTVHPAETPVRTGTLIHPRVEPEIVFVMGERLEGPGVTAADVMAATEGICCGLEILDSRFADFSFAAPDVIADNTSEAGVVLGPRVLDPSSLDLRLLGLILEQDGDPSMTAAGAACLGHPAEAVALLANWLAGRSEAVEAGWLVFSGGLTPSVPLEPGHSVAATFAHLGSVSVRAV
ncbi:fumarylacetoacetate hydrolase family protein [Acidiferrimicrobium sp. IK]|uniref:2-keto-4-pentenoate hydratase n=1 Tax=Acidiferrimicrobium sp. IK TaxID=2871700 RepID=UPI0021CB8B17|nr:fumarylacetoacetate hydrolase family protein [Acidiferrimicrobium sp. IK]MCU4183966.1 fumarylacetoacetate hydrolase family protein [Acidiferrimicrobium sp. IK]